MLLILSLYTKTLCKLHVELARVFMQSTTKSEQRYRQMPTCNPTLTEVNPNNTQTNKTLCMALSTGQGGCVHADLHEHLPLQLVNLLLIQL